MKQPADADVSEADRIDIDHYSTAGIVPAARHQSWSATGWPSVAALFKSQPLDDFSTEADLVQLDRIFLQFAYSTARHFERPAARAAGDGIDVLGIGIQLDGGAMVGEAGERAFAAEPGAMLLLDMTRPCSITHPSGPSIQLALPRDLAQHFLGPIGTLHGVVVPATRSSMLISHLLQLRRMLPDMAVGQQQILMRTVLDLIAVALGRQAVIELPAPVPADARAADIREAACREIDLRLGLPSLNVGSLCERLGISRSSLFRLFEADGGVQRYIRGQRLEQVRQALLYPANRESVADLAHRLGFSDASHLTRHFRQAFGLTPSAYRQRGASD